MTDNIHGRYSMAVNVDEAAAIEERLKTQSEESFPESWKPTPGQTITARIVKYDRGYTSRGDQAWILVVESLRQPGKLASVWLLHTALRNKVNEKRPQPGEVIFLRYDGMVTPKHGGDQYHGWTLAIDRDEATNPTFGFPWDADNNVDPRTEADTMLLPNSTAPPHRDEPGQAGEPWNDTQAVPVDDDIPF